MNQGFKALSRPEKSYGHLKVLTPPRLVTLDDFFSKFVIKLVSGVHLTETTRQEHSLVFVKVFLLNIFTDF